MAVATVPAWDPSAVIEEGLVWKGTANADLVVLRKLRLHQNRFYTYHDYENDPDNKKTWFLDRKCELTPRRAEDIITPQAKYVRPRGTWTITATVTGGGERVKLYIFSLLWPRSWAAKGYTSFEFGFETVDAARRWHSIFNNCIEGLKQRSQAKKRSIGGSTDLVSRLGSDMPSSVNGASTYVSSFGPSVTPFTVTVSDDAMSVNTQPDDPAKFYDADELLQDKQAFHSFTQIHADDSDSEIDELHGLRSRNVALSERWVPYRQTNGVAIYHHEQSHDLDTDGFNVGGEYMVSVPVRGRPADVLDVLMRGSANTTILGPASKVEVLACTKEDAHTTKEVLRIMLEAPGWAGTLCAPREMVVERLLKADEGGVYCVLFSSIDDRPGGSWCSSAEPASTDEKQRMKTVAVQEAKVHKRRLFQKPVPGKVRGGYTIAPLHNYKLETSPEALITCIIKVDLGGACGSNSWFKFFADNFGWTDAFLDRMLMSVILVRDEVEHSRFVMEPFSMIATEKDKEHKEVEEEEEDHGAMAQQVQVPSAVDGAPTPGTTTFALEPSAKDLSRLTTKSIRDSKARRASLMSPLPGMPSPNLPAAIPLDVDRIRSLSTLEPQFWDEIHQPGKASPFKVRGPTYLKDRKKIPAGNCQFIFASMDVIELPHPVEHVARFLPAIRDSGAPFSIIINLIIPGTPLLGIVATFVCEQHPDILGQPPRHPMEEESNWQPFDYVLYKFLKGDEQTRNLMLKLIPHIADGSWMIKQSVGTTPVILGKALKTTYHQTSQYIEIDIDVSANNVAAYVTGLVRGATKSLVIDMGFVLEGTAPWELPESLLGALRLVHLDLKYAKKIDVTRELPLRPALPLQQQERRGGHSRQPSSTSATTTGGGVPPPTTVMGTVAGPGHSRHPSSTSVGGGSILR